MKILIAYDGSDCANGAIGDLSHAGLPDDTEALILNVTETWLPKDFENESFVKTVGWTSVDNINQMRQAAIEKVAEGEKLAGDARRLVQQKFPAWQVRHKAIGGFAEREIVSEANESKPDLIVIGSHGRGGMGRLVLGSVSLKVLSEADCSVRVARPSPARAENDDSPMRIIIGFDGSPDSLNAVEAVMNRQWLPETSVRLISAVEPLPYSVLLGELPKAEELRKSAAAKLKEKGLHVSTVVEFGRAKNLIIEEAEKWGADSIFIGAKGYRWMERIMLGSVSYSVAARAACSVEVVR
jgi:nucleotide-binding universal stress UspA family protein